ncbi:MAG: hypothetical protein UX69_C0013G0019 [candidate division WWE3 bacterium GW2011_GWA2_46_9]|uniref:Sortase family protein n=1 Tax=candidate division WWE3 bacterium GW2011_GWA2_46_9 TaxID=1619111 RepID=A0A0G1T364_UNCKA|nr:MAG: hypothetical protein UX69_C0013G0019 [candidate division WWE3 bacterium GW2011_GWA2_46_9]
MFDLGKKYFEPKRYVKDGSFDPIYTSVSKSFFVTSRVVPTLLPVLGVLVFATQILIPLVVFKTSEKISRPVSSTMLGLATGFGDFKFDELRDERILGASTSQDANVPRYYTLTIPKLGIYDAAVETFPENLDPVDALGHYPGSALPGSIGTGFIYGHSVLPWFYNPKNYKTIFSTLDTLAPGDEFTITYNNSKYTYAVEALRVLKPNEVNPLAEIKPRYLNESTIVLMTCVPPGTRINRLLVDAVLKKDK